MKTIVLVIGTFILMECGLPAAAKQDGAMRSERLTSSYKFISPLLECESDEAGLKLLKPFRHKLVQFLDHRRNKNANHISVYYRDLKNGPWMGVNESENFSPASLLKVPLMMSYFKLAEDDPEILNRKLKVDKLGGHNAAVSIRPSKEIQVGETYTIEEVIQRMIVYSDNEATVMLSNNTTPELFSQTYQDLGLEIPGVRKSQDFMSVREYASFFRILFNASYLNKKMSEKALNILNQSEFKDGIVAGVPKSVPVAHKFGERVFVDPDATAPPSTQLHDCGIVYFPNRPYLLCIMTRGTDAPQLISIIKDVSQFMYQELDQQLSKSK